MKLSVLLVLLGTLRVSASVYSQDEKVNLNLENATLEEVLVAIQEQSGVSFVYKQEQIADVVNLTISEEEARLDKVLGLCLANTGLNYEILNKTIIIKPRPVVEVVQKENMVQQNQSVRLSGVVKDAETNEPLVGVNVYVKGTTTGAVTDYNGEFNLKVNADAQVLVFSFIGFISQEITIGDQRQFTINMKGEVSGLDEVVVVGYGTMQKRKVTSSISTVKGDDLVAGVGGSNIANALQGKVSGLIISANGSPNSSPTLQLRGVASVTAGKSPLVVIDGMPGGDIRSVVQEDILSIDVLKDASAGAIYGTRAAGGVILITTKQAKANKDGKVKLTYTGEFGFKQEKNKPEMLSAEEYLFRERGNDYGSAVDWWDELINDKATSQKHVVNLSGGNEFAQIYTTFMYNKDEGIAIEDQRTDYSGRLNANFNFFDKWLEIKTRIDYRQAKRNNSNPNFQQALRNNPTRSPYDPNSQTGYNVWLNETMDYNVLADSKLYHYDGLDKWFKPDITLKLNVKAIPGLSLQQTVAYENRQWEKKTFRSKYHREELENNRKGTAHLGFDKTENLSSEGYGSYIRDFNKHFVNAVAGYSYYEYNSENFGMDNYNFTNDLVGVWDIGEGSYLSDGEADIYSNKAITQRLVSMYARGNYSYDDKYMVTGSVRREGSSKFAKNSTWGTFWSVSGGWRISKESFMKNIRVINDLKLRVGYGVTGNNNFGADYAATMYGSDAYWLLPNGTWAYSYGKTKNINPDLRWEEQKEWNAGLDYSLLDNRLYGKIDIYKRKVEGMIYNVQVPQPPYTRDKMYKNIGNMENKGWEFEIGGDVVRSKDWTYSTSMSFSNNETNILTLWGDQTYYEYASFPAPGSPGTAIRIEEGVTVGDFYLWKFAGFDDDGGFLLYDKDDNVISASDKKPEDKRYVGNFMPKLIASWNHRLRYKNLDFTMNMRSWIDFDVYNAIDMYFGLPTASSELNVLKTAYTTNAHITGEKELCDYFLEDGTFLKIDNINLGYNLDLGKYTKFDSKARFYLTVNNVATFTDYSGVDPEVDVTGLSGGIEWFSGLYPQTRTYTLGVQLTF